MGPSDHDWADIARAKAKSFALTEAHGYQGLSKRSKGDGLTGKFSNKNPSSKREGKASEADRGLDNSL